MDEGNRYLRIALIAVGIAFLLIYPLMKVKNQLSGTIRMMRENLYYLESLFTS